MDSKLRKARRAAQIVRQLAGENDRETDERTKTAEAAADAVEELARENEAEIQVERRKSMDEFTKALNANTEAINALNLKFVEFATDFKHQNIQVNDIDCIVRGPNKDDGMVTDMLILKNVVKSVNGVLKYVIAPLSVAAILSVAGMAWAILTHLVVLSP
jgi:hypothetical protein